MSFFSTLCRGIYSCECVCVCVNYCETIIFDTDMPVVSGSPTKGREEEPSRMVRSGVDMMDYYPGMEISGYMPYRGDFAIVSVALSV